MLPPYHDLLRFHADTKDFIAKKFYLHLGVDFFFVYLYFKRSCTSFSEKILPLWGYVILLHLKYASFDPPPFSCSISSSSSNLPGNINLNVEWVPSLSLGRIFPMGVDLLLDDL